MTTKTPKDVLQGAYDILEERGWCQGAWANADGQVCLGTALYCAASNEYNIDTAGRVVMGRGRHENAFYDAIKILTPHIPGNGYPDLTPRLAETLIPQWNDYPSTTVEDIKLGLKKAIEEAS